MRFKCVSPLGKAAKPTHVSIAYVFYKFLALYHAGSKIVVQRFRGIQKVECVLIDSFTLFFVVVVAA